MSLSAGVPITPLTGSALVAFVDPDGIALELYGKTACHLSSLRSQG